MSQSDTLISTAQAAELLNWSKAKVKREAKAGRLPYVHKMPGDTGAYLFDAEALRAVAA